ncbi:alpha/beta fold hydrolase [Neolewinella persica]|uniref:alpha/beta fold hydrolase n=1 Tax=Neolewinella persica TaxID=70998 RepID=UPI00036D93BB|nr:alpha/beta hydrolase [Neolewinella persica]
MAVNKEKLMMGGLRRLLNGTARVYRRGAGKMAYYLLTTPRRLADDPGTDEFLKEATQGTFDHNGQVLHCFHWPGDGPSVLLLHGWESSTARWFAMYEPLKKAGFDIYAIDAPAHGRSEGKKFNVFMYCEVLNTYFNHLGFAPDYWVGHSGGGMAAIYYACKEEYTFAPKQIVSMAVPGELENFIDKFCEIVGANDRVKYGIEHQFHRQLDHRFSDIDFTEFVKKVEVPGLIVHDEEDDVAPIAGARRMHANWRGSTLATTVGSGHSLTGDLVPAIVVEYLLKSKH